MKKRNVTLWVLAFLAFASQAFAQVNMPLNTGPTTFSIAPPGTCSFNFFDNGGSAANYSNNSGANSVVTFTPSNAATHRISVTFSSFSLESGWDIMYIFNGTTTAAPAIAGPNGAVNFPTGGFSGTSPTNPVQGTGATGALTFQFRSDASVSCAGWAASVVQVPLAAACTAMAAPANVAVSTSAGVCEASTVTVNAPTFTPANCNTSLSLQYRVNGGAPVVIGSAVPATITLLNIAKGTNTITWELVDPCGGAVSLTATSTVTVSDLTPPVITCPASTTINLNPGFCAAPFSYSVTATDNCPFAGPITTSQVHGSSATNNNNFATITFGIRNDGTLPIAITGINANLGSFPGPAFAGTVATRILQGPIGGPGSTTGTSAIGAWTAGVSQNIAVNVTSYFQTTFVPLPANEQFILQPGQARGIAVQSTNGNFMRYANGDQTTTDGTLTIISSGHWAGGAVATLGNTPRLFKGSVQYNTVLPAPPVTQTAGLPSGSEFPIGTTTNSFSTVDAAGNPATCSFTVTVNEYPNAITALICNDMVQVSLDEDCVVALGADQILEGGPYGCYDDYVVEVDRTPQGNGPWAPAVLGAGDVGKTYDVRVTDPATGNMCWGKIKVEDKLPPVIQCRNQSVVCNGTPVLEPAPAVTGPQVQTITGLSDIIENGAGTSPRIYNFNYGYIPTGTPTLDVNVRIKLTGHTWLPDLSIFVINPQGQQVRVFGLTGCTGQEWPIDVIFDDEGTGGLTQCVQLNAAGARLQCLQLPGVQSPTVLNALDGANAGGTWQVRIEDSFPADDGVIEEVGLEVTVDAPRIPVLDNCGAGELTLANGGLSYTDAYTPGACGGPAGTIVRTWIAKDASGNTSSCTQTITFTRPTLADVVLPPDYDGVDEPALDCSNSYPTPAYLNSIGLVGYPTVFGSIDGCNINFDYEDQLLPVCDGTYKIKRTWTVIDWCSGTGFDYVQLIKVADHDGPEIACPANMTVSTDPYTCCATVDLPNVIVSDDCSRINNVSGYVVGFDQFTGEQIGTFPFGGTLSSFPGNNLWTPDTLANFGFTACLPLGTHTVYYVAEDDCGNTSACSFRLTVRDLTPPTVASDEYTVVSIGLDDPFDCYVPNAQPGDCQAGGVSWIKASTFDDGSYDNCNALHFTVQRMQPYSDCIQALNSTNGFDVNGPNPDGAAANCFDPFPDFPSEFERAISEGDSIKFYCCEVGTTQTVIFRAYQLNADGSFSIGLDGLPVVNSTMVQVEVQDKLKPACQAPANVTVSCEAFDPSLWAYGNAVPSDNCCLDTTKVYQGQCGLTHATVLTNFDSLCNKGTITRRWTAYDCHGLSSQCTQRIVITYNQNYWLKFPADRFVTVCDGSTTYGAPEFYGEDCELLATSYTDEFFTVVPDACFKIERTWRVINWCTYNPNLPCVSIPNPNPNATTNHPTNFPGVTISPVGTTVVGWQPTIVKINPTDPTATNYGTFWTKEANCYTYKQIIKVYDTQDPTVAPAPTEYCDFSTNDPQFWNAMQYWDATISSHDLCEGDANLEITATDACSGANLNFRYLLFLDLDGNGSMETVVNSVNPPGFNNVNYNNINTVNYAGGTPWQFDFRPVPGDRKWGFGLQVDAANGNSKTARVRWFNQANNPASGAVPQLPYGKHKIKWFVEDGCGNETIYEHDVVVKDCKKPTVVCLNGLSINLMNIQGGMVALWASDFLQYTEDNCTPSGLIKIGIRRVGQPDGQGATTGFPKNADGTPQTGVTFTCADLGTQLVELWGLDAAGNADYCETYVLIQDNAGVCGTNADIAGALKNESAEGVEDATVELDGSSNGTPMLSEVFSNVGGEYLFSNALPITGNATVTPTLELDPLNGVNTWDLILMSRHILGLEPLNTPYKLIAADANKSGTITTFDIVELRKLILGTYQQLPNNSSWRFIDKSQQFTNNANPFADVIRENLQVANIQSDINNGDFVATKIGDVDGTATPNGLVASDDRTAGTLLFDIQDRAVKAGETFTVNFKAADKAAGYQFTMNTTNLEVLDIVGGEKMSVENFAVFADAVTTSADGTNGEFAVTFRANADGQLSQMLSVSSRITKAVAFDGTSKLDVAFRFNNGGISTIAGVGFELYQNSPNPFVNKTFVGFHLPEATSATLSVYDETGRVLYTTTGDFGKGYNAISLDRTSLNANGVLYYKLETANNSASKKMIQSSK